MAGTLVDFPEVMRCGEQEKNKGLVWKNILYLQYTKLKICSSNYPDYLTIVLTFPIFLNKQRLYQKNYHQSKTKTHLPPDIIANKVAKRCQDMLSDVLYRTYLHQWTCHPEQEDAIRARKTNEILSDVRNQSAVCWLGMSAIALLA